MENPEREILFLSEMLESHIRTKGGMKNLCRACLTIADPPHSLFSQENHKILADLVWICAGVHPIEGDGLPEHLCPKCCTDLSTARRFKTLVQKTNQLLQQYNQPKLNDDEIKREPEIELVELPSKLHANVKSEYFSDDDVNNTNIPNKSECFSDDDDVNNTNIPDMTMDIEDTKNNSSKIPIDDKNKTVTQRKVKKFKCNSCGKPLSTKYSLKSHLQKCQSGIKQRNSFITGWGTERKYNCSECPYTTRLGKSFFQHMRIHTGEKPYKCDECEKCFTQQSSLIVHKRTHSDKTYYTCAECGKQFKYKGKYEAHKNVHNDEKKYECSLCNAFLKTKETLKQHMNRHNNIRNYNCETCGLRFVTRVELTNHFRTHKAEKKFACHLCSYKTYIKQALDNHLRRHSGERPFKCDMCDRSCFTKGELKCHIRKHTKEKNYSCPVCDVKFIHSSSVNKHMFKEHGVKYRRCDVIDRRIVK